MGLIITGLETLVRWHACVQWGACHFIPGLVVRNVPHGQAALSLGSLYLFAQALGLLWLFLVSMVASFCTRLVGGLMEPSGAYSLMDKPLRTLCLCYVYYCVVRINLLFGRSMWTVAWELYHNFPTLRRMLVGAAQSTVSKATGPSPSPSFAQLPSSGGSFPNLAHAMNSTGSWLQSRVASGGVSAPAAPNPQSSPAESPRGANAGPTPRSKVAIDDGAKARRELRRRVVMVTPLLGLVSLNCFMLLGQVTCECRPHWQICLEMLVFFNPTSMLNRNLRFVLFLSLVQWLQAWTGLFPNWDQALLRGRAWPARVALAFLLLCLVPVSYARLLFWFVRPAGSGVVYHLAGVKHHLVDSILVLAWSVWCLVASFAVMSPEGVKMSGFTLQSVTNDARWKALCSMFKYTMFFWMGAHFVRGCVALGLAYAQNDLIIITMLYPMVLCLIWTMTFIAVAISGYGRGLLVTLVLTAGGFMALLLIAWTLCAWVSRGTLPLLVVFVWLHLCRQAFRVMRRWTAFMMQTSIKFAVDPNTHKELRRTYSLERRLGRMAIRVLLLICASFCAILATFVLLAGVQQRQGLFIPDVVWWNALENGLEMNHVNATILSLWMNNSLARPQDSAWKLLPPEEIKPSYGVCRHVWHGLQLLDYTLLAAVAYIEPREDNEVPKLLDALFPHMEVTITKTPSLQGQRRWLELEVQTCKGSKPTPGCKNVTVITVSGTDISRALDYSENIRMWTEPVSLQILSTVFPTVRIWPRNSTGMVIGGLQSILSALDLEDDQWHYHEILDHVKTLPESKEVVLTGHSLGGGISLVVGALTGRLAVAIQPPGVYHSFAKHQAQQKLHSLDIDVHRRSVSLVFEGDWIQNFDGHAGLVQTMTCDQSHRSIMVGCHLLEGAVCHLLRHCGDTAHRFSYCRHVYHPSNTVRDVTIALKAFLMHSWESSHLGKHVQPMLVTGVAVSAVLVARYGAPQRPSFLTAS